MRAMLCRCHHHLEAADEEGLFREVLSHLRDYHPVVELEEEQMRNIVAEHSYHYECIKVYAAGAGPDEEFGPEPY